VDDAYAIAEKVLSENHAVLRQGAQLLLEKETLSGDEIPRSTTAVRVEQ
jgi:ATP-dependent Zn protease